MALNIAVPLSGLGGLSPISPIGIDCWENIKMLVSPIGSESSGVSSLDSEDAKQQVKPTTPKKPEAVKQNLRIVYNGRDILDLYNNLDTNSATWKFRYSHLPEKNNISMFWANRSLYNRLGPNGLTPVYTINKCECCDFQYTSDCPNSYLSETSLILSSTTTSPMIFTTASNRKQEHIATKVTTVSTQLASNATPTINQQFFAGYKNNLELSDKQLYNQNNVSKTKLNDMFSKKINNYSNVNNSYNNFNKFNNLIGTQKNPSEVSPLATALTVNVSNSPTNASALNVMMGYNNNNVITIHHNASNETTTNPTSKYNVPQNFFNNALTFSNPTTPPAPANHNYHNNHINASNNILSNNNGNTGNSNNKTQVSAANNFYSLFNTTNTNNSAAYGFNMNGSTNNNAYMNSLNTLHSNSSNINSNPLPVTSQHYGRMYKYF